MQDMLRNKKFWNIVLFVLNGKRCSECFLQLCCSLFGHTSWASDSNVFCIYFYFFVTGLAAAKITDMDLLYIYIMRFFSSNKALASWTILIGGMDLQVVSVVVFKTSPPSKLLTTRPLGNNFLLLLHYHSYHSRKISSCF